MGSVFIFIGIGVFILIVFYLLLGFIVAMAMTTSGQTMDSFQRVLIKWPWYLKSEDYEDISIP